jgi:hypothetical protein
MGARAVTRGKNRQRPTLSQLPLSPPDRLVRLCKAGVRSQANDLLDDHFAKLALRIRSPRPCFTDWVTPPGSDEALLKRQAALHSEATEVLTELGLAATLAEIGTMLLTGSYVSHLMCWPEVDVMVHAGARFAPDDVLRLLQRIVAHPAVVVSTTATNAAHDPRPALLATSVTTSLSRSPSTTGPGAST